MAAALHERDSVGTAAPRDAARRREIARDNAQKIRDRMRRKGTTVASVALEAGATDSLVHRWVSEAVEKLGMVLAVLDLKLVDQSVRCVSEDSWYARQIIIEEYVDRQREDRERRLALHLLNEEPE